MPVKMFTVRDDTRTPPGSKIFGARIMGANIAHLHVAENYCDYTLLLICEDRRVSLYRAKVVDGRIENPATEPQNFFVLAESPEKAEEQVRIALKVSSYQVETREYELVHVEVTLEPFLIQGWGHEQF